MNCAKPKVKTNYLLVAFAVIATAFLIITNPKQYNYEEKGVAVRNSAINMMEKLLLKAEQHFLGATSKDLRDKLDHNIFLAKQRTTNYYLFSIHTSRNLSKWQIKDEKIVALGIIKRWYRLKWLESLPDCTGSNNCSGKGNSSFILVNANCIGLCIGHNRCLCIPSFKSETCKSPISKFKSLNLLGQTMKISLLDAVLFINIGLTVLASARFAYRTWYGVSSDKFMILMDHFTNFITPPNIIHYIYSLFLYHKYAPTLYSVVGSDNFGTVVAIAIAIRFVSCNIPLIFGIKLKNYSSLMSVLNLSIILVLRGLQYGADFMYSFDSIAELAKYISVDVLLSIDLRAAFMGIESLICTGILLRLILEK